MTLLDKEIIDEAIELTRDGFTQRDLHKYLFVDKDVFLSWFTHGKDMVNEGYGRLELVELANNDDIDNFDLLCITLYKGITTETKEIRRQMHRLVAESDNPNMAFTYLKHVYSEIYDPKYSAESDDDIDEHEDSATSFVMKDFFQHGDNKDDETEES